jgi:Squalene-hopene cyclase C-terminal domain/Prenyltransferase and squalene oxidase repeat
MPDCPCLFAPTIARISRSANPDPIFPLTPCFRYAKFIRVTSATDFLISSQNRDGGWGYKRGGMSYVEPTAAVLLALADVPPAMSEYNRAARLLHELQHDDGGWGIAGLDGESGWMTSWAVWALAQRDRVAAGRGADWLLRTEGIRVTDPATVQWARRVFNLDATLTGWPWQPGDASWVFPTALALLALNATTHSSHPRVEEGIRYLLDRAIPSGGWNIGDPFMLTGVPPATVLNSSLALISLGGFSVRGDVVERGYNWLALELDRSRTPAEMAWSAWAARRARLDAEGTLARLRSRQQPDGSFEGNPLTTAIAIMAAV